MADVAPISAGSIPDFGLMQSEQAQNTAGANLTNQQAQLTLAQTQAADIANQRATLMLQLYQRGMQSVLDFSGQNNGQHPYAPLLQRAADESGATSTGATASPGTAPQSDASSDQPAQPIDDVGASAVNSGEVEASLESVYNVNPAGTPQEQQAIAQAYAKTQDPLVAMNPQLSQWAQAQLTAAKAVRDQNVMTRQNTSRVAASQGYDLMRSVQSAPDGQALQTLRAIPGGSAAVQKILAANPGATPEQLDEIARDSLAHTAGFLFRFTGRPATIGPDGNWYDKQSGLGISGAPPTGFSQAQVESIRSDGLSQVQVVQNGHQVTEPKWQASGAANIDDYVQRAVNNFQALNRGREKFQSTALNLTAQLNQLPGNSQEVRQRAAQIRQQQQQQQQQPGVGAPPGAPSATAGNVPPPDPTMPGSDPKVTATALQDQSFRPVPPPGGPLAPGAMRTPDQQAYYDNQQKNQQALYQQSQTTLNAARQRLQLLQAAQGIINSGKVKLGSYSGADTMLSHVFSFSGGGQQATYMAELKKDLGNAALLQAKGTYGGGMTQQEAMVQKDELSPNTAMPPQAAKDLIAQQIRGAQYDIRAANLAPAYLRAGLDPNPARYQSWLQTKFPYEKAVNGGAASSGASPSAAPVQVTSPAQVAKLPTGTRFITPDGRVMVRN